MPGFARRSCRDRLARMERWGVAGADEEDDRGKEEGDERGAEAEVERAAIADGPDNGGRDGVAESVDDEELTGECCGADLRPDCVHGRCVDRAGPEEDEEDSYCERGHRQLPGPEEADDGWWNGEGGADCGDKVESLRCLP